MPDTPSSSPPLASLVLIRYHQSMTKEKTNYKGKAAIITAKAKANATIIAALSGLLLAGGNFVNDLLDRHHQRRLDESTYNATLAEIRSLRDELDELRADLEAYTLEPVIMMDDLDDPDDLCDDDLDDPDDLYDLPESPAKATVATKTKPEPALPKPDHDLVRAPSFDDVRQYVQKRGKALSF